jgi:succinyl-diaminopimelate desuccinylase
MLNDLISKYQQDIVSFISDLIKIPSVNVNKDADEMGITKRIEQECVKLNLPYKLIASDAKRPNIYVGQQNSFDKKDDLLFIAHLDTVPVGDETKWTNNPFSGEIIDNKIFGRGAIDNKGGAALAIYAVKILNDLGFPDDAKFVGVVDEEGAPDSKIGAHYLLEQGLNAKSAIYCYYNYDTITIGHRGIIRLWIRFTGEANHTGSSSWQNKTKGASVIETIADFVTKLREIKFSEIHESFPRYGFVCTPTILEAGSGESIVPDKGKLLIDIRMLPNHKPKEIIEKINLLCQSLETEKMKIALEIRNNIPGAVIDKDLPIVKILASLVKEVGGVDPVIKGCGPVNEGYMFIKHGIPTICGFGPKGDGAHSADEYLDILSIPIVLKMYVEAAIRMRKL